MKKNDFKYINSHTWPVTNSIKMKSNGATLARWRIGSYHEFTFQNKRVTLYLKDIWEDCNPCAASINEIKNKYHVDPCADGDYEQRFLNRLIELYLTELCCMERFREGARIQNRCHPSPCACEEIARSLLKE